MADATPPSGHFLRDCGLAARRAEAYWKALRAKALSKLQPPGTAEGLELKSSLWPALVYAKAPALAAPADALARDEAACFASGHLVHPARWRTLTGWPASDEYELFAASADQAIAPLHAEATALLRRVWPEAHDEISATVRGFGWFRSARYENFSDPKMFGIVFLNRKPDLNAVDLAVDLVHECGHHALFVESAAARLLQDAEALLWSPLRRENRPAIGVLHAAVAMARMLMLADRLAPSDAAGAAKIRRDYLQSFRETLDELSKAPVAPAGERLVAELRGAVAAP